MRDGHIDNFLIPCFCRKLFEDKHPSKSGRHYFFSYVGVWASTPFFQYFVVSLSFLVLILYENAFHSFFRKASLIYLVQCRRTLSVPHFLVLLEPVKGKDLIYQIECVDLIHLLQFFYTISANVHVFNLCIHIPCSCSFPYVISIIGFLSW
jgi:hypothetical protein